ncbi:MAG: alpha/beta fold hydrolase [Candidatus Bathyarchaeota archaeon]
MIDGQPFPIGNFQGRPLSRHQRLSQAVWGSSVTGIVTAYDLLKRHDHVRLAVLAARDAAFFTPSRASRLGRKVLAIRPSLGLEFDLSGALLETEMPGWHKMEMVQAKDCVKTHHIFNSEDKRKINLTELSRLPGKASPNGKCVVLMAGIANSTEAFFRIGTQVEEVGPPILNRLLDRGFTVLIFDFPGLGKNENFIGKNDIETAVTKLMPHVMKFLLRNPELYPEGLYFLAHSMGGMVLNTFMAKFATDIKADPSLTELFKNKMTLGTPEIPLADAHALYPSVLAAIPVLAPYLDDIPVDVIRRVPGRVIPYSTLIGGRGSMISFDPDYPPALVQEMFDFAVKRFSLGLAMMFVESFRNSHFPDLHKAPPIWVPGQRNVRLVTNKDPLAPVESLVGRMLEHEAIMRDRFSLWRIERDGSGIAEAVADIGVTPITGISVDDMSHLDIATPNQRFETCVWPIILKFLQESA